jgi:hypothetical protein
MEVEDLRRFVERWHTDRILDAKVDGYVHDCDAKTRSLMCQHCDKPEFLDANHILKGFDHDLHREMLPHRLKTKLRRWFLIALKMEQTTSEKVRFRQNSVNYYQGTHMNRLPHAPDRKPPSLALKSKKEKPKTPSDSQQNVDEHFAISSPRGGRRLPLALAATDQIAVAKANNDENIARLEHFLEGLEDLFCKIRR